VERGEERRCASALFALSFFAVIVNIKSFVAILRRNVAQYTNNT
jgi:hypothetical protein